MKPIVALFFLLACCGALLGDPPNPVPSSRKPATLSEDLVRLTEAGSSDATVLAYARAHRLELPPEMSDADLRWLRDSGVSETVVRYMTAIDVRASDEGAQEGVASGSYEDVARPRAAYSYSGSDDDGNRGSYPDRYADSYADNYADSYSDAYPADYDYDPFYDYGYYPYPLYVFADRPGFFVRFPGRDRRFRGHRGFDGGRGSRGQRGGVVGHGAARDPWRERGFSGRRGSSIVVRPRGTRRPTFAHGGFGARPQGPHGRAIGHRGFGPPGPARGSFPRGFRGGVGDHTFGHPGFSGGPHTGGGFGRGPRVASGSSGGRGRR